MHHCSAGMALSLHHMIERKGVRSCLFMFGVFSAARGSRD